MRTTTEVHTSFLSVVPINTLFIIRGFGSGKYSNASMSVYVYVCMYVYIYIYIYMYQLILAVYIDF